MLVHQLEGHTHSVFALAFGRGQNGNRLFTGGNDGFLRIWDPHLGEELLAIPIGAGILSIAVSPDGKSVAAGDQFGDIRIWESERPSLAVENKRRKVSEARELVDGRLGQVVIPDPVVDALKDDDTIDPVVKRLAPERLKVRRVVEALSDDDTIDPVVKKLALELLKVRRGVATLFDDDTIDPVMKKLALELLKVRRGVRAEPKKTEEAP